MKINQIYKGDCVEVMSNFPKESIDLIFSDPPYNLSGKGIKCKGSTTGGDWSMVNEDWDKMTDRDYFVFTKNWIKESESLTLGFLKNDKLFGYGMIRKCVTGYKIGPLFADSSTIAEELFKQLNNFAVNFPIFFDVLGTILPNLPTLIITG